MSSGQLRREGSGRRTSAFFRAAAASKRGPRLGQLRAPAAAAPRALEGSALCTRASEAVLGGSDGGGALLGGG